MAVQVHAAAARAGPVRRGCLLDQGDGLFLQQTSIQQRRQVGPLALRQPACLLDQLLELARLHTASHGDPVWFRPQPLGG
jgi:hypothetical protein